jgi:hypothetical protein
MLGDASITDHSFVVTGFARLAKRKPTPAPKATQAA